MSNVPPTAAGALTAERVTWALTECDGNILLASRALGVSRNTVYKWVREDESVRAALEAARESTLDQVENALVQTALGSSKQAVIAQIFFLKTQGKRRGYVERVEQTGADGAPLVPAEVVIALPDNGRGDSTAPVEALGPGPSGA